MDVTCTGERGGGGKKGHAKEDAKPTLHLHHNLSFLIARSGGGFLSFLRLGLQPLPLFIDGHPFFQRLNAPLVIANWHLKIQSSEIQRLNILRLSLTSFMTPTLTSTS